VQHESSTHNMIHRATWNLHLQPACCQGTQLDRSFHEWQVIGFGTLTVVSIDGVQAQWIKYQQTMYSNVAQPKCYPKEHHDALRGATK